MEETTNAIVNSSGTNDLESKVPLSNSKTWEQFRRAIAKEVPTTLAARPCQPPNNKRSTRYRLQDEYLSGFPKLLKLVNDNEKVKGKLVVTDHPPLTILLSTQKEHAVAEPETLGETTFPISCILKSQSYMGQKESAGSKNCSMTK